MKILLVNPPTTHQALMPGPARVVFDVHVNAPPMGLMYLKSYIERETDSEVRLFNFQVPKAPSLSEFRSALYEFQPDVVGITIVSMYWYDACQTAREVRKALPGALVVGGGAHMNAYPGESLSRDEFDAVVVGEGEVTLAELVKRLERGRDLGGLEGTWYKSGDEIVANPPRPITPDPDRFPFPDRSDFDIHQHRVSVDRWTPAALVLTSRGCPHHCTFCQNTDRLYRTRRPELVVDEILQCREMGYRSIDFYDDNLNQSKKHVEALCREIIEREINMPWACRCRVDRIDRDLIRLMARAGCERIHFGVESASQETLDRIRKGTTVEQCRRAFAMAKQAGIYTLAYFIIGFPGETREEAKETLSFAFELDPDYAIFFALIPAAGTPLYEQALKDPAFGGDYVRASILNPAPHIPMKIWPTAMSKHEIMSLLYRANLRFYFRPRHIMSALSRITSADDFFTKVRAAVNIITAPRS